MRSAILLLVLAASCSTFSSFDPKPVEDVAFLERAERSSSDGLDVTVSVLSEAEARDVFGVNLYGQDIQPVYVEVTNNTKVRWLLLPAAMDPDYYSPFEAAWQCHWTWRGQTNRHMDEVFFQRSFRRWVEPGQTQHGFVYTNLDLGAKFLNVEFVSEGSIRRFQFIVKVPGLRTDVENVEFDDIYKPKEIVDYATLDGLRKALEALPRATVDKKGKDEGDPVNFVVIGNNRAVISAFIRRNWHLTETMYGGSNLKTVGSFLFGSRYRYSPVSALYVFGRPQDIALQKARGTIHQRNHLRLWLAPMTWKGKPIWAGQISRDIGVTTSRRTIITHKIDPDVDETRFNLAQDMFLGQSLEMFGYCHGVGRSYYAAPRVNLGNDPFYTDGLRAVMFIADEPMANDEVKMLPWDKPARD